MSKLFRPGGPLKIRDMGNNRHQASVTIPRDEHGRIERACPTETCTPGTFKVMLGTGLNNQTTAFCPYCRHETEPANFATKEQIRFAKDSVLREARKGVQDMVSDAFGLGPSGKKKYGGGFISMEVTLKRAPLPMVRPPKNEEVRRDVVCPTCSLDQSVFGFATWCADCGSDIFVTHVAGELEVVRRMVGDIDRRRSELGHRVAARDLENYLEDAVSIFEAAMRVIARRSLALSGMTPTDVEATLKKLGNAFQNITKTQDAMRELLGLAVIPDAPWAALAASFQKRHPITHNLGVADRKYLANTQTTDREGREVVLSPAEVEATLNQVLMAVTAVHAHLFRAPVPEITNATGEGGTS